MWYNSKIKDMRKLIFATSIFFVFSSFALGHATGEESNEVIHINENGFDPQRIEIFENTKIVFENTGKDPHWPASNVHPTHELYSEFDPRHPIASGESWSFVFRKSGIWQFHDHLYPSLAGSIVVNFAPDSKTFGSKGAPRPQEPLKNYGADGKPFFTRIFELIKNLFERIVRREPSFEIENTNEKRYAEVTEESKEPEKEILAKKDVVEKQKTPRADVKTNTQELLQHISFPCPPDSFPCASKVMARFTKQYGPQTALEIFGKLQKDGRIRGSVDDHQLAHEIGRETARNFGVNTKSFLLCPMSAFNGGCQHGFFEYVLGKTETTAEAADLICASLDKSFSPKFKFYCYHGVGHGVMMAQAYDLYASIGICDTLKEYYAQDGCWQGVFMENANAGMQGTARKNIFSKNDPLAPCNSVEEKYRHECFINHAGWLMKFFHNDVKAAAGSCLKAPQPHISSCLQSIGLMVTNPSWQLSLLSGITAKTRFEETAWRICEKFPHGRKDQCVIGGVDNIMNFHELDVFQAKNFCDIIDQNLRDTCYQKIGMNLRSQTVNTAIIVEKCSLLGNQFKNICLSGAGI